MVKLHVKRGDESLFLYETTVKATLNDVIIDVVRIQNQRLKIERLYYGLLFNSFFNILFFIGLIFRSCRLSYSCICSGVLFLAALFMGFNGFALILYNLKWLHSGVMCRSLEKVVECN